jgi:hypothetical protein
MKKFFNNLIIIFIFNPVKTLRRITGLNVVIFEYQNDDFETYASNANMTVFDAKKQDGIFAYKVIYRDCDEVVFLLDILEQEKNPSLNRRFLSRYAI